DPRARDRRFRHRRQDPLGILGGASHVKFRRGRPPAQLQEGVMLEWLKQTFQSRRSIEKRSSASGFTAEIIAARESYISGRRGIGELTATAQGCISLWEGAFSLADVTGTDMLDRRTMALLARSAALRGEAVFLIRDTLIPCSDWDLRTRY